MSLTKPPSRRVVLVYWKNKLNESFEVYSNLKNFCISNKQFNYNTLNNYLSKRKIAYENNEVRIERKSIITEIKAEHDQMSSFKLIPVVRKRTLKSFDEEDEDLQYWLSKTPQERIAAVTFIIGQSLKPGERMNKAIIHKRKLNEHNAG
jgi:hypothetical protein